MFSCSYVYYAPILYLYAPDHWCTIPQEYEEKLNASSPSELIGMVIPVDETTHQRSKCYIYDIDGILGNNKTKIKCPLGWQYNFTEYYESVSTQVWLD